MRVRRSTRTWVFGVLLLTVAAIGHLLLDSAPGALPAMPIIDLPAADTLLSGGCTPTSPTRLNSAEWTGEGTLLLASNDVVRLLVCSPGTLTLSARGSEFGGVGAYMVVSQLGSNLWEGAVTDPVDLALSIRSAGWVSVAFVNDRFDPPADRNLWLESLEFHPSEQGGASGA